jgi:hypothetical protein
VKSIYRGHEIIVEREKSRGGWSQLTYSVFRISDGYECTSGFEDSEERVLDKIRQLQRRVDTELAETDPWGEKERDQ